MGEEGLEYLSKSMVISDISKELALKLALFDISEIWQGLNPPKRAAALLFLYRLLAGR